jgi:hypothetical protein
MLGAATGERIDPRTEAGSVVPGCHGSTGGCVVLSSDGPSTRSRSHRSSRRGARPARSGGPARRAARAESVRSTAPARPGPTGWAMAKVEILGAMPARPETRSPRASRRTICACRSPTLAASTARFCRRKAFSRACRETSGDAWDRATSQVTPEAAAATSEQSASIAARRAGA